MGRRKAVGKGVKKQLQNSDAIAAPKVFFGESLAPKVARSFYLSFPVLAPFSLFFFFHLCFLFLRRAAVLSPRRTAMALFKVTEIRFWIFYLPEPESIHQNYII